MADDSAVVTPPSRLPWVLFVGALLGAIAAGVFAWKAQQQAGETQVALDEALERAKLADEARVTLEGQLAEAQQRAGELAAKSDLLEAELAALKETTGSLEEKLQAEIAKGEISVSQRGDRIQVDLIDSILFDSAEAALATRGQEVLGRVAAVLETIEDKQIQVSGHTDDIPIKNEELKKLYPTNWELSVARAVNVVRYLSETGGVKSERLTAAGYGQFHPIATNATPKGRAKNRRIEILLTPTLDAKKAAIAVPAATDKPAPKK